MNLWQTLNTIIRDDDKFFDIVVKIWKEMEKFEEQEIPPRKIITSIILTARDTISENLVKALIKAGYSEEEALEKSTNLIIFLLKRQ